MKKAKDRFLKTIFILKILLLVLATTLSFLIRKLIELIIWIVILMPKRIYVKVRDKFFSKKVQVGNGNSGTDRTI